MYNKVKSVYLAISADKYELPLALFLNLDEACKYANKSKLCFSCAISRQRVDKKLKCRYVKVKLD